MSMVITGLGMAAIGYVGSNTLRYIPKLGAKLVELLKMNTHAKYYKGGFHQKMTKQEAALILNVNASASKVKIHEAYRRIMLLNHPDRGGSPLIAAKINEAKEFLECGK